MAELVHLRLEHGLEELEEMERTGLFSKGEIKKIIKKRKAFEYRLRRKLKRKEDFMQYIEFEMCLLLLISKRRERLLCDSKKKEIDNSIAKKINRMFKAVISRYPEDEKLWLNQIEYLKRMKWNDSISALFTKLLQVHSKSPRLWVLAAQWEREDNNSFENARKILQRGVLMNPKSEIIWREYFKMELTYIDVIRKRREILQLQNIKDDSEENDAVLKGEIINVVYVKAVEEIPDVEFALSFIQICLEFDFALKNIDYILNDVQDRFSDKEEALDALAKRPLLNLQTKIEKEKHEGLRKNAVLRNIYKEIFSNFDDAVETLPTEKMWNFYFDFMFSLLECSKEKMKQKIQADIMNKMEKAAEQGCLSQNYYTHWVEMLISFEQEQKALLVSLSSAKKWNNATLWIKCLTLHIQCRKSSKTIYVLFLEALTALEEKESVPVWRLGVDWLSMCDPDKLIEFFEKGINKCAEVSLPLKEMYLEATALRCGVEAARSLYKKFKRMSPLSLELIRKIILIEKSQLKPPTDQIRKYLEDGVKDLGSDNIDIWLEYMQFDVEHCSMLYWRAIKTLKPELLQEFQARITEYRTGSGVSTNWELISG